MASMTRPLEGGVLAKDCRFSSPFAAPSAFHSARPFAQSSESATARKLNFDSEGESLQDALVRYIAAPASKLVRFDCDADTSLSIPSIGSETSSPKLRSESNSTFADYDPCYPLTPLGLDKRSQTLPSPLSEVLAVNKLCLQRSPSCGQLLCKAAILSPQESLRKYIDNNSEAVQLIVRSSDHRKWQHLSSSEFTISTCDTPDTLKERLCCNGASPRKHELLLHSKNGGNEVLTGGKPLSQYGISPGSVLELVPVEPARKAAVQSGLPKLSSPQHQLFRNFMEAKTGLAHGQSPELAAAGTGGSYFMHNDLGEKVAVFKPSDEEPNAVNNPRDFESGSVSSGESIKKGVLPGEGAVREVAAYLLDHHGFAGVPPTALVTCRVKEDMESEAIPKVGSLQQFVTADFDCEEHGYSSFPVDEVHKIAVLDMRLANTDRHGGNILARQDGNSWRLIPIDHGCCLPDTFEDITFEWLYWPQAEQPFTPETLQYIRSLDADKDLALLESNDLHLRLGCKLVFYTCTMLLQKAAAAGMTAYDIGYLLCGDYDEPSPVQELHEIAMQKATLQPASPFSRTACGAAVQPNINVYRSTMNQLLDAQIDSWVCTAGNS